jgi:plastocyanin
MPIRSIALASLAALPLLAGCGSTANKPSSSSSNATTTAGDAATTNGSSLKVTTTPKFGTPPAGAPVHSGLVTVTYRLYTIEPDTLRVRAGSTVRWTNDDAAPANVTSVGGSVHIASGSIPEGKSFSLKLTRPGVIHYVSTDHPETMNGTIEVV